MTNGPREAPKRGGKKGTPGIYEGSFRVASRSKKGRLIQHLAVTIREERKNRYDEKNGQPDCSSRDNSCEIIGRGSGVNEVSTKGEGSPEAG